MDHPGVIKVYLAPKLDGAEVAICRPSAKHAAALVLLSKGQIILDHGMVQNNHEKIIARVLIRGRQEGEREGMCEW